MSNEMYNTVARVTDGLYEGNHIVAALFNFSSCHNVCTQFRNSNTIWDGI